METSGESFGLGSLGSTNTNRANLTETIVVCYIPTMITTNGVWQGDNPFSYSLPVFILQLTVVGLLTRVLFFILKPLRQPRVISEIIAGIILGPSCLGRNRALSNILVPLRSITVLETMANLGLLYFLFLVGIEMDLAVIKKTGRKALVIAIAGMALPFVIGASTSLFLRHTMSIGIHRAPFLLFLGVALSVTAFPVLARILAELKLLNTDLGRLAMSAAIINDVCAWIILALAIALSQQHRSIISGLWVVLSGIAFVLFCFYALSPAVKWVMRHTPEGETFSELHICTILIGVLVCGFITDAIGIHAIFGAFVFGLVIPNGPLGVALIEKMEDFVSGLLLPLYFAISGLRTDLSMVNDTGSFLVLLGIIAVACAAKVLATLVIAIFYKMHFREGLALGMLMNTKGLIEVIVLNVGRDQQVLDEQAFAVMVISAVIVTGIVSPVVVSIYRPSKRFLPYKRRTIQRSKPEAELRMLACIHSPRNVPTIINLLEASHHTRKAPIFVYALHLVELTGRASAMLIVHNTRKPGDPGQAQSNHIVNAFENYEHSASGISIQPLTAMSPYPTMHEDICNLAEDKRVAFIIIPFHKQQTVDGEMEATVPAFRSVNQNVLANAPCSVGILVDRGLGGTTLVSASQVSHHIAVLFFGGPDDREALAYAWRMSEHPGISVTVVRFMPGENVVEPMVKPMDDDPIELNILSVITDSDRERHLDEEFVNDFRLRTTQDESVMYIEKVVNNGEETVAVVRSMGRDHDLFIVGRGQGMISPLTAGLTDWSECPELGGMGDLLASSDFAATVSVLVVQQYVGSGAGGGGGGEGVATPDSPGFHGEQYLNNSSRRAKPLRQRTGSPAGLDIEYSSFSRH